MSPSHYFSARCLSVVLAFFFAGCAQSSFLSATSVCQSIANKISSESEVIYPLDVLTYESDISHWFLSSTQSPACVLQAGSAQDVSIAIKAINETRTPFAVYSGGHTCNPGFSSTTGVQISFQNMKQVVLSSDKKTVEIGMGQNWASVYQELNGTSVNVVGGRVPGPGVGGFTLGGGYAWITNQYGLTCDNVESYNLVLPNGTITKVTSDQQDLWFALKGGLNRFGIVTSINYNTVPQIDTIYGGFRAYAPEYTKQLVAATLEFYQNNTDPKAQIITTLDGSATGTTALILFFYDGPEEPSSFAPFAKFPALLDNVKAQSFSSFVSSVPSKVAAVANERGTFNTLSTSSLTAGFLAAVQEELNHYGATMLEHGGLTVSVDVEPFLPGWGSHAVESAYPHDNSPLPLNLYFSWSSSLDDDYWYNVTRQIVTRLKAVAIAEGISNATTPAYPNYAIFGTSASALYGATNAARLASIKAQVDPYNVMELAGGFNLS